MKVIPQSFKILTDLDAGSLAQRIEACGRICYKSEDKISAESTEPFIKNILKRGHNSVAEMAVLTLKVAFENRSYLDKFYETLPKYFVIDHLEKELLLITGSVRAFRELYLSHATLKIVKGITSYLAQHHPLFFFDLVPNSGWQPQSGVHVEKVRLPAIDELPVELHVRHRHIAVKFITNRAVSHELVRHRPCSFLQESQRYCRYDKAQFGTEVTFIKPLFFEEGTSEYGIWEQAMLETERLYLKLLESSSAQAARTVLPNSCKTEIIVYANLIEWLHILKLRTSSGAEPSMREIMNPLLVVFQEMFPAVFGSLNLPRQS